MKTAMQELIDNLKQLSEDKFNDKIEFSDFIKTQEQLIEIGLEKEKEQIKDAWDAGMSEGIGTTMADLDYDGEFINYYNQTFNENK